MDAERPKGEEFIALERESRSVWNLSPLSENFRKKNTGPKNSVSFK